MCVCVLHSNNFSQVGTFYANARTEFTILWARQHKAAEHKAILAEVKQHQMWSAATEQNSRREYVSRTTQKMDG